MFALIENLLVSVSSPFSFSSALFMAHSECGRFVLDSSIVRMDQKKSTIFVAYPMKSRHLNRSSFLWFLQYFIDFFYYFFFILSNRTQPTNTILFPFLLCMCVICFRSSFSFNCFVVVYFFLSKWFRCSRPVIRIFFIIFCCCIFQFPTKSDSDAFQFRDQNLLRFQETCISFALFIFYLFYLFFCFVSYLVWL